MRLALLRSVEQKHEAPGDVVGLQPGELAKALQIGEIIVGFPWEPGAKNRHERFRNIVEHWIEFANRFMGKQ